MMEKDFNKEQDELDLLSIIHQLLVRKRYILFCSILFGLLIALYVQASPNIYTASSVVQIEKRSSNIALSSDLVGELLTGGDQSSELETEFHVIKSRLTLGEVVKNLQLNVSVEPIGPPVGAEWFYLHSDVIRRVASGSILEKYVPQHYPVEGEEVSISNFEALAGQKKVTLILTIVDQGHFKIRTEQPSPEVTDESVWKLKEEVRIDSIARFKIENFVARPGVQFRIVYEPVREAARKLAQNLDISERGGRAGTGIVDFSVTSTSANNAISIVNSVVNEYQRQSLSRRSAEVDQSIRFIEEQLPVSESNLQAALKEFNSYIEASGAYASLSATTQEMLARIVDLETQLEEIKFQKSQLATQVTESHPDFQRVVAQENELRSRLATLRVDLDSVPETEQKLAQLTKNVQAARELKEQLLIRLDQLRIVKASAVGKIRILESAEDASITGPNRLKPVVIACLAGFIFSSFTVLFRNSMRSGIEDTRDIEELGLSIFATIPLVERLKNSDASDKQYALAISDPENIAVEAMRALRTGLHFSLLANSRKSILITSPAPNEGKSFVSLNLALVAAQTKAKVLLIDTDLRRGELHKSFGLSRKEIGLSQFLAQGGNYSEFVHHSQILGVDFMPTGGYPPNPSELLSTQNFNNLIEEVEADYDLVIFDCAPILAVTDPVVVAGSGMPAFLIVTHMKTTSEEVMSCTKAIANIGKQFSGVIVNSYDQKNGRYGAYSSRYGYYHGGYRYEYKKK